MAADPRGRVLPSDRMEILGGGARRIFTLIPRRSDDKSPGSVRVVVFSFSSSPLATSSPDPADVTDSSVQISLGVFFLLRSS